jgi:hypothetical protein
MSYNLMNSLANIIYVSGSGRSGSTLLERLLHSSQDIVAVGELHCLWRLPADEITCSCGKRFGHDSHWQAVMASAGIDADVIAELSDLEARVCRTGFLARHRFSLESLAADPLVRRFLTIQFALFEAIAAAAGAPVVVDSSKAGPRAWLLACDPRTRIVHVYRDPADVILSWRTPKYDSGLGSEMKRMSVGEAAMDWWKVEQLIRLLPRDRVAAMIDYRALCAAPRETIERLMRNIAGQPIAAPQWLGDDAVAQGPDYHSVNGNPDRFDAGPIRVSHRKPDWARIQPIERTYIRALGGVISTLYPSSTAGIASPS